MKPNALGIVFTLMLAAATTSAFAQGWAPQKNVEIVAGSGPGGSNDNTARTIERTLASTKLVPTTLTIVNKPGGGGNIAGTYVAQRAGDAHYLLVATSSIASNHINGSSTLTPADFTPLAIMLQDYVVFAVATNSPMMSGRDLAERLKKDPRSVTIGFANTFGGSRHVAAGLLLKSLGGNPRDLKPVVFKGSAEAIPAVLGGHIDIAVIGAVNAIAHVSNGRMRVLGVAAPQRLGGVLANAPTWREQGVNVVSGSWRGIFGPKGLTPAQIVYWENALRKVSETPEWKADLEKNFWTDHFVTGAALKKELEQEYAADKAVLVDLGLAKQ
ncbi:MAG: tripartite tricarboxylate transporter substrate binding protein [Burkholderiales bacterium]